MKWDTFITFGKKARENCRKALAARLALPASQRFGTLAGIQMARDIAAGRKVSARKVAKFFPRWKTRYDAERAAGRTYRNSKVVGAWYLWGGTEGWREAERALMRTRPR